MLVSAAVKCQFCQADVSKVPRTAGQAQPGASRWQQEHSTGPDWNSIMGYVVACYWLAMAGFRILTFFGGDFMFGGLGLLGSLFVAYAFFFRPDWAQNLVRVYCAIAIASDLIGLAFTFVFSPLAKGGSSAILMVSAFLMIVNMGVAGYTMYLSGDERGIL